MEFRSNAPMETIGDRVRKARVKRGMTPEQLRQLSGIAYSTLIDLENNRSQGSTKLHRIATALGVSALALETGKGFRSELDAIGQSPGDERQQTIDPIQKKDSAASRLVRLDPVMIRNGFAVVNAFFTRHGSVFQVDVDPDLMARIYEFEQSGESSILRSIEADIVTRLAERGGQKSGQNEAVARRPRTKKGRGKG